jgi:hypothetical protein
MPMTGAIIPAAVMLPEIPIRFEMGIALNIV